VKKKLISVLIFVALIIFGFIVGFKYAINYNLQLVSGYANIANWSLKSQTEKNVIKFSEKKLMPGTKGSFFIDIDASGAEVEIEYKINTLEEKNIPRNMKFYGEIINEKGGVIKKTEKYNTFKELASKELNRKNTS
jgi:hypothetical protein